MKLDAEGPRTAVTEIYPDDKSPAVCKWQEVSSLGLKEPVVAGKRPVEFKPPVMEAATMKARLVVVQEAVIMSHWCQNVAEISRIRGERKIVSRQREAKDARSWVLNHLPGRVEYGQIELFIKPLTICFCLQRK
ncbi:MAG: hypothetical protein AB1631_07255 [Acidobacteriota bacterium]